MRRILKNQVKNVNTIRQFTPGVVVDEQRRNRLFRRIRDFETRGLYEESDAFFASQMEDVSDLGIVRNDRNAIDLHGCDRLSAECVLRYTLRGIARGDFISTYSRKLDSTVVTRDLHIITGIGRHSQNGKSVLRPHMSWYLLNAPDPPLASHVIQDGGILMVPSSELQRWVWKGANLDPWMDRDVDNGWHVYSQQRRSTGRGS
jgi:hypothetical protein